ncbi:MAG: hypothetical protein KGY42_01845, partial [Desulfobacterales bacterium]|nr:hypothetical protein [Desulfobacterales bacterium]
GNPLFRTAVRATKCNFVRAQKRVSLEVQYLRYAQFLRISRTAKYAAFFEIAQALILNFLRRHLKLDFLREHQILGEP